MTAKTCKILESKLVMLGSPGVGKSAWLKSIDNIELMKRDTLQTEIPLVTLLNIYDSAKNTNSSIAFAEQRPRQLFSLCYQYALLQETHVKFQAALDYLSALVVRFLTKRFIWEYDPTLEFTYRHQAQIDDESVQLEILDTASQDQSPHWDGHIRWGDGFMLVYSVTDKQSFLQTAHAKRCLDDIRKSGNVSCILVGNKLDLEHERQVSTEEGERLATELACAFFETSACDGGGEIDEAFHELHREVRRRKNLEGKTRRRSSAQQMKQVFNKMFTKIQSGNG